MKKIVLALFSFCLFFPYTHPIKYTNKTYMALPTPHYYLPMKYSCWHRILKQGSSSQNPWGTTIQGVPFYRMSNNTSGLGKYFGTNHKNILCVGRTSPTTDFRTDLMVHKETGYSPLKGKIKINPKHTSYGLYLSVNQELNNINDGLFFQVSIPFQYVENDLRMTITDETRDSAGGIAKFFSGGLVQTDEKNLQSGLRYLKICGPQNKTGVADLEILLGHKLADKKEHQLSGALKLIVPTGSKPSPCYLFPPVIGNGHHWGFGAQFHGSLNVTKGEDYSLECLFSLDYTYEFKSDEKRTLGYRKGFDDYNSINRGDTSSVLAWNYYILAGEAGKQGTFPFANVLTQDVSVTPGGKFMGNISFAYHRNNTAIDFGYNIYAQEGEKISINCWEKDKYAPADPIYSTDDAFKVPDFGGAVEGWSIGGPIQHNMLDLETPATPAALKHAIHAAISYTLSEWESPLVMGCGFSIDWMQDNSTATGYTLWSKMGITF